MSSSQPFLTSSPTSFTSGHRRKSRFTYKHLSLLSQSSTSCPLRVIAHIDLDAFYAQCESVRLNVAEDQPLAVQVSTLTTALMAQPLTISIAMVRLDCYQLSGTKVWRKEVHHNQRSEKAVPRDNHATCGYLEGRGREVGVP